MTAGASPEALVEELTLAEQVALLAGVDFWHTASSERLGIPALRVSDGPVGAKAVLLDRFRDWYAPIPAVIDATPDAAIIRNDIFDRSTMS